MKILVYPHKILSAKAEPVDNITGDIDKLAQNMLATMYQAKGIGLAANQVGVLKQVVIVHTNQDDGSSPLILINPEITAQEGEESAEEGCLSVPTFAAAVKRAASIEVRAYDLKERELNIVAQGLLARCIQHELDHLNGICFVDRLSSLKKALFRKKWAKIRRKLEKQEEQR